MAVTPYLFYEDLDTALKFLAKAFGFKKQGRAMAGPDGKLSHAAMKVGDGMVMMGRPPDPKYKNPRRLGQTTQCLYVNVSRVDKHFERAKHAGAKVIEEPKDTEYGHRRYGAEDPEGHQWYFAQDIKKPAAKNRAAPRRRRS